jgi:lactoylglutathione lyase
MMTKTGFHHVSFTVSDVDAVADWFCTHFKMVRLGGGDYDFDYIRAQVGMPDVALRIAMLGFADGQGMPTPHRLELIEYVRGTGQNADTATNRPGNAHLCFLTDDIDGDYLRLSAAGAKFISPPNTVTWGINKGARAVYFKGPDDIRLELLQPRRESADEA